MSLVGVAILSFSLFQYGIFTKNIKTYFQKSLTLVISFFAFSRSIKSYIILTLFSHYLVNMENTVRI